MRKLDAFIGTISLAVAPAAIAAGADSPKIDGSLLSVWWVIPFAGILLSIAFMPLFALKFWHHHFGKVSLAWTLAFVLPFAAGALGLAVVFADPGAGVLAQPLRSYWLNIHPMLLMTAYAAFATAAAVGLAMLIQESQIKSRKPTELCYRLPSLDELDALNGRTVAWAYPFLVVGLVMGFVWAYYDWGKLWTNDPKLILALVTAALYGAFLGLRYGAGRRGRRPVYLSLLGFASVLITFFGAEVLSGKHSYMGGPR